MRASAAFGLLSASLSLLGIGAPLLCAQQALTGPAASSRIFPSDLAVIEAGEARKDLPCNVTPNKPILGFDLKFHSGYELSLPLRELSGNDNLLTIVFRVSPADAKSGGDALFFTHKFRVPSIEEEAKGEAFLQGTFDLGEGKYRVDWLVRDRAERVCADNWEIEAVLPAKDKQMALALQPGAVQQSEKEQFRDEPPVQRAQDEPPLNLKVLVNFAPQNSRAALLQPLDTSALVSILRSLSRDPRVGKFTIVAFNLHEQKILYRQESADHIDFPSMGKALNQVSLATVDLKRLGQKNGDTEFLTDLISKELQVSENPDAVVFAGPKALLEEAVPPESLRQLGAPTFPVFYMNYNLYPQQVPWTDAIGKAVRHFKGQEFTITRPRDLWFAVSEMVSRIVKLKHGRQSGTSSE